MQKKFQMMDDVVAHTITGTVKAEIINYSFSKSQRCYIYDVKDANDIIYSVPESHIEKYRLTAEEIIKSAKKEFYKDHPQNDKPYEPYAVIGALIESYDSLSIKYAKLEEKYREVECQVLQ